MVRQSAEKIRDTGSGGLKEDMVAERRLPMRSLIHIIGNYQGKSRLAQTVRGRSRGIAVNIEPAYFSWPTRFEAGSHFQSKIMQLEFEYVTLNSTIGVDPIGSGWLRGAQHG